MQGWAHYDRSIFKRLKNMSTLLSYLCNAKSSVRSRLETERALHNDYLGRMMQSQVEQFHSTVDGLSPAPGTEIRHIFP